MEAVQDKWICGFWRRIGALFVDSLILGFLGYILGFFLEDAFAQLGLWAKLIGFAISITYFGVMNSSVSNGQTIGKKLLKIRVVDASNSTISLPKSFLRYSILATPFFLNGAHMPNEDLFSYLIYPFSFIVMGGLFSTLYLYLFNRLTRQSLHDLVVGTFVVNSNTAVKALPPVWKPHFIVIACFFIIATIVPALNSGVVESNDLKNLLATQEAVSQHDYVKYVDVNVGEGSLTPTDSDTSVVAFFDVQAFLSDNKIDDIDVAKKIAGTIVKTYPEANSYNFIQVKLIYGYDMGIASKWYTHSYRFNLNEKNIKE